MVRGQGRRSRPGDELCPRPVVVIVFFAGWLWGTRNIEEEGKQ